MKAVILNKKQLGTGLLLGIWLVVLITVFLLTLTQKTEARAQERRLPVYSVERSDRRVALTFDVAWGDETTDEVLALLEENGVKATFFFVGTFAEKYPDSVKKIAAAGHEIGNHSYDHTDPTRCDTEELTKDMRRCNELLERLTGIVPKLYRAPSGAYSDRSITAAESLGMTSVQWDADSIDWKDPTPDEIVERIRSALHPGSILLFHLGKQNTLQALPKVLTLFVEGHYQPVTVSELLLSGNTFVDANGCQHPAR